MVGHERDSFMDLERHRLALEQNVAKLRASLQHWQAWEIEYEGLKEDILRLGDKFDQADLEGLGEEVGESAFPGQNVLLTPKERRLLLWDEKGYLRETQQILGLLSRRVDYVQQNIKSVYSLLRTAEEKFIASQVLIQPEVRNEEGLPLTEILEELDVDGNVISGSTSEPGKLAPQVVESLRKVGVTDSTMDGEDGSQPQKTIDGGARSDDSDAISEKHDQEPSRIKILDSSTMTPSAPAENDPIECLPKSRKSVSFAESTKEEHDSTLEPQSTKGTKSKSNVARRPHGPDTDKTTRASATYNGKQNITLYDEEEDKPFDPVIPNDESPEDAALRREMIQYNMGEVGAIVAELNLSEDDTTYSDEGSGGDDYDNSSVEEDEDQFGRARGRVLTEDYLAEMQKLQQRLTNIGPSTAPRTAPPVSNGEKHQEHNERIVPNSILQQAKASAKKGVRFAKELNIQEAPLKPTVTAPPQASSNTVKARASQRSTHTPTVIERPFTATTSTKPAEPDEYDPGLVRQEVKTEYHRMRNYMIQRQGGFRARQEDEEKGEVPLTEAEGGPKKMSRFKAARLGKLGP